MGELVFEILLDGSDIGCALCADVLVDRTDGLVEVGLLDSCRQLLLCRLHQRRMERPAHVEWQYVKELIEDLKNDLSNRHSQLEMLNPMKILKRGYSISLDEKGNTITSIHSLKDGQKLMTVVEDGTIISTVESRKENK